MEIRVRLSRGSLSNRLFIRGGRMCCRESRGRILYKSVLRNSIVVEYMNLIMCSVINLFLKVIFRL